jgi:type II secretion system protein G
MFRKNTRKGFSLVELLVVITIIAIMSVVAYTAVGGQTTKAKNSRRTQDIGTIQQSLELYFVEKGVYPDSVADATVHTNFKTFETTTQLTNKYISKTPLDPWSTDTKKIPYSYGVNATTKKQYQLAATIEGEATNTAYVVGNGTGLILSKSGAVVTDGGSNIPYEQQ